MLYERFENFTNVPDSTPLRLHSLKPRCKISFWQEPRYIPIHSKMQPGSDPTASCSFSFSRFLFDAASSDVVHPVPFCTFRSPTPLYPWKLPLSDRIYGYFFRVTYTWTRHVRATSGYKVLLMDRICMFGVIGHNFAVIHEYNRSLFIRACREISIFAIRLFV